MQYIFKKSNSGSSRTLLLLHGTGGNENDLIPLAQMVDANANILSVRGDVLENGMNRFFKRLSEGIFDEKDLIYRTKKLHELLDELSIKYDFNRNDIYAIGYSNGANIAASLFFHYSDSLAGAILHYPMVPIRGTRLPDLTGRKIFIAAGKNDPLCRPEETEELSSLLMDANADVTVHWENKGHQLTSSEVEAAKQWYEN